VRFVLGCGVEVGRALVGRWPSPRVTRRRRRDRRRRRRVSTRFTIRTLSPAISVNALFRTLYRSTVLVIFVAFLLNDIKLFRCVGSFWLGGKFVRYLT
jgi:hypothetical protein